MEVPQSESNPAASPSATSLTIKGISEPTLLQYFETFNRGNFEATACLFAAEGAMHPPFESPIVGRDKITAFLEAEAKGMRINPREGIAEAAEVRQTKVQIGGTVQTSLFSVNAVWHFILNQQQEILSVRIKLLASPQELLNMQQ